MRNLLILLSLLFMVTSSYASIDGLIKEYLEKNYQIKNILLDTELSKIDIGFVRASKSWNLVFASAYDDNQLDSSSHSTLSQTKTFANSFALSKEFMWGGELSFENSLNKIDMSRYTSTNPELWSFEQSLSYSQNLGDNFLGRNDRLDEELAQLNYKVTKSTSDRLVQGELLSFYNLIMDAYLNKAKWKSNKEALIRSEKRVKLIYKRVKDGLNKNVDYQQAKMDEFRQKEAIETAKINLDQSLREISTAIHRKMDETEINLDEMFNIEEKIFNIKGSVETNRDIGLLKEKINSLKQSIVKTDNTIFPNILLSTSLTNNRYANASSDSISEGRFGEDNKDVAVGLTITMPLGFKYQRLEKSKLKASLMKSEYEKDVKEKDFAYNERLLRGQISHINNTVQFSKKRAALAKKALKGYNRLYNLGRADLIQVINAEEDQISTEVK